MDSSTFSAPQGYSGIRVVHSFEELMSTPLSGGINALCWQRALCGDFAEVVTKLAANDAITTINAQQLDQLDLSEQGRAAATILKTDLQLLQAHGLAPELNCILGYPRDEEPGPVPTDVYSFHADSAPVQTDTYLCSYTAPTSEALRNEDAIRCIDIPATRAALLGLYGGEDDAGFREYLSDNCFDLHYEAVAGATPITFGLGNLWRIAVDYPGSPVPPCVHRAPDTRPGQAPRLLLIS